MRITCPHCWEPIDIETPLYASETVELVADCEVCCRPIMARFIWESPESEPHVEAEPES